jgi:hypothetical protein
VRWLLNRDRSRLLKWCSRRTSNEHARDKGVMTYPALAYLLQSTRVSWLGRRWRGWSLTHSASIPGEHPYVKATG